VDGFEDVEEALHRLLQSRWKLKLRESVVQDALASLLRGERRVKVDDLIEVDVLANDIVIEIKVNRRPYDGFLQALLARKRCSVNRCCVVHIFDKAYPHVVEIAKECAEITGVPCFIVDLRSAQMIYIDPHQSSHDLGRKTCCVK